MQHRLFWTCLLVVAVHASENNTLGANQNSTLDVLKSINDLIRHEMDNTRFVQLDGLIALLFGLFMVVSAKYFFKGAIMFVVAVVMYLLARGSVETHWLERGDNVNPWACDVVGFLAGSIAAVIVHSGWRGVLIVIGSTTGFAIAKATGGIMVTRLHWTFLSSEWFEMSWYFLFAIPGAYLCHKDKYLDVLVWASPFVGGAFISSALWFFSTELFTVRQIGQVDEPCRDGYAHLSNWASVKGLDPKCGSWFDFAEFLLNGQVKNPVGICTGSAVCDFHFQNVKFFNGPLDRWLTILVWIIIFFLGGMIQRKFHVGKKLRAIWEQEEEKKAKQDAKEKARSKASGRESLSESLLVNA